MGRELISAGTEPACKGGTGSLPVNSATWRACLALSATETHAKFKRSVVFIDFQMRITPNI